MSDKKQDIFKFLNELRGKCRSLTNAKDIFVDGVVKIAIEDLDKLIGMVEQQQQKIEHFQEDLASWEAGLDQTKEMYELQRQLQQAQKRIQYFENELRNCGYSDTDLDNDFLSEFQDKQVDSEGTE